jgi:hypothetical protein
MAPVKPVRSGHTAIDDQFDARDIATFVGSEKRYRSNDRILKSVQASVAEKQFADLDPVWGNGIVNGDQFAQIVYVTL